MKFQAIVKKLNDVKSGVSENTGDPWKYRGVILETQDGERVARWLATLGTKMVDEVARQGITEGSKVIVNLHFFTQTNYNKYVDNKVFVDSITLVSSLPPVQTPTFP